MSLVGPRKPLDSQSRDMGADLTVGSCIDAVVLTYSDRQGGARSGLSELRLKERRGPVRAFGMPNVGLGNSGTNKLIWIEGAAADARSSRLPDSQSGPSSIWLEDVEMRVSVTNLLGPTGTQRQQHRRSGVVRRVHECFIRCTIWIHPGKGLCQGSINLQEWRDRMQLGPPSATRIHGEVLQRKWNCWGTRHLGLEFRNSITLGSCIERDC
ncbi:hypothetical protein R1flu_022243 [Riccia fluitans]|uniref:Uncharacterized protein n=1 Tax=Riccia fluitans TaxID=41844 RepID=A0ABD1ZRY9_9MARC